MIYGWSEINKTNYSIFSDSLGGIKCLEMILKEKKNSGGSIQRENCRLKTFQKRQNEFKVRRGTISRSFYAFYKKFKIIKFSIAG